MKKMLFVICLLVTFTYANAQKNVIKINPSGLLGSSVGSLSYERVLSPKSSAEIAAIFFGEDDMAYGVQGRYKFYLSKRQESPRGWYASPLVSYVFDEGVSDVGEKYSSSILSGGILGGYQWIFGRGGPGFVVDVFFGGQYNSFSDSFISSALGFSNTLDLRVGITLGYAF